MIAPNRPFVLARADSGYPVRLCDLSDPPDRLACVGALPELTRAVAIVGTRACDAPAYAYTRALARELSEHKFVIVSGGAAGIDAAAHEGALDAGGPTLAVLATGLQKPFPRSNWRLFERIVAEGGALVCEHGEQQPGHKGLFLSRNRLVAALGQVLVVTQAPFQSGAMNTAAWAQKLGRPILVTPHSPWDVRGQGCLELFRLGAGICRTTRDVLSIAAPAEATVPPQVARRPKKAEEFQGLDDDQRAVVRALSGATLDTDALCEHSGLSAPRVQRAVLMLLLTKVIHEVGSGRYMRADYP